MAQTEALCRRVAYNEPAILVQNATKRTYYAERANEHELIEFIHMLKDSAGNKALVHQHKPLVTVNTVRKSL